MEKLEHIMDGNQLCIETLNREIARLKMKLDIIDKAVYEGYYDEIGNYILTFNKDTLEKALQVVLGAKEVTILH